MADFTPGPWTIDQSGGDRYLRATDGSSLMCDMQFYPWTPDKDEDWNLIAAAPDMYAALEAFVEAWDKSHQLEKTDVALRMAHAALAKAEGKKVFP